MARRKRKQTLFDVINTGQPKGLQVRNRVPTYQPTPELPVQKKLAKLFGRRKPGAELDEPLTASQKLEQLRRELSPPPAPEPIAPILPTTPRATTRIAEYEPEEPVEVPAAPRAPAISVSDRVRMLAAEAEGSESPTINRSPGKPIGQIAREQWSRVAPKLATLGQAVGRASSHGLIELRTLGSRVRDANSRYAVTALTACAVVVFVGGSYFAGRLLLNRPPIDLASGTPTAIRSDVLDLAQHKSNGDTVANVDNRRSEPTLERSKGAASPSPIITPGSGSGVFGGRDLSLNYVIIQSCQTQADADATVEMLAKHNVPATVELNLGFNQFLPFAVVSTEGFARMSGNTKYTGFLSTLNKIGEQEAGVTIRDRLDPQPFKYRVKH